MPNRFALLVDDGGNSTELAPSLAPHTKVEGGKLAGGNELAVRTISCDFLVALDFEVRAVPQGAR